MADKIIFEVVATAKGVKVVQQQTDKLANSTDRANKSTKKLDKSRDAYNRREKGAANISSNSTKNFSKMQQGIDGGGGSGGLVRAYALLAANVFALTAAFGVLSRSAQIDTLVESMEILSTTGGTFIRNLAREMQEASGGAIDLAQAFRQVSLASSAGLNTTEIEGLTKVARGAATSLGRNLPDAMDRIFRGAIKLEPEILDEIGLFVRVDEAAQKFATTNGKVVSTLTQVEKRQAFLNEILEQGGRKFSQYAEEVEPDVFVKLGAALQDIAQNALSLVNEAFKPFLSFLSESKGVLTALFGVVVVSLLKLAIPAIGQFNQKLAQSATLAATNASDYADGLKTTAKAKREETIQFVKDEKTKKEALMAGRADVGSATYNRGTADEKNTLKRLKGTTDMEEKAVLTNQRITDLKKKQGTLSAKNNKLINQELKVLKQDKVVLDAIVLDNKELLRLEKEQLRVGEQNFLVDKNQRKLDAKALMTKTVAGVTGTAETDGVIAGFKDLGKQIKTTEFTGNKFTKTLKGGMLGLKGSIGILGVGFSSLMASLGPIIMAFTILAPVIAIIGKNMGLGSKEAQELAVSLDKISDANENLLKRVSTQVEGMKSLKNTFLETLKASEAFFKGTLEGLEAIKDLNEELEFFLKTATDTALFLEFIKSIVGADMETKVLTQTVRTLSGAFLGLASTNPEKAIKLFGEEFRESALAASTLDESREALRQLRLELNQTDDGKNFLDKVKDEDKFMKRYLAGTSDVGDVQMKLVNGFNISDKALIKQGHEYFKLSKSIKLADGALILSQRTSEENLQTMDTALPVIRKNKEEYENLRSALEGAKDSVQKFQASFMPKTKVDDVLSSFETILAKVNEMSDEAEKTKFFESFGDSDNFLAPLMKEITEAGKIIIQDPIFGTQFRVATNEDALRMIVEEFKNYKETIMLAKLEQKQFTSALKQFNKISAAGGEIATKAVAEQIKLATSKRKVAQEELVVAARATGMSEASALSLVEQLSILTDISEIRVKIDGLTLSDNQKDSLKGSALAAHNLQYEERVALQTQEQQISILNEKIQQNILKANKELNKQKVKGIELDQKIAQLGKTGSAVLNPQAAAKAEVDAAFKSAEFAKEEVRIKTALLDYEMQILQIRLKIMRNDAGANSPIGQEIGFAAGEQGEGSAATGLFASGDIANKALKEALGIEDDNIGKQLKISVSTAISNGFKTGVSDGISASNDAIKNVLAGDSDDKEGDIRLIRMQTLRDTTKSLAEDMKKLGPEGEAAAAVMQGALVMADAFTTMSEVFNRVDEDGKKVAVTMGEKIAAGAAFAAQALGQINQMMAANSRAAVAEIDKQIEAEKKRDGKSTQSLSKIKQLETKKEAMKKKAFEQDKKMKMAQTVASTAAGIAGVLAGITDPIVTAPMAFATAVLIGAMGAASLAMISKTSYQGGGGSIDKPTAQSLSIGKRDNKVDVSRGPSSGELAYMRGARGTGTNANNFTATGGAYGMRNYAHSGEGILVGEQGPEVIQPTQPVDVIPMGTGGAQNVNFTINAVDADGIETVLENQRGNIIGMIRSAANGYGTGFLEEVDTDVVSSGGYQKA